jgi:hypothetical protein
MTLISVGRVLVFGFLGGLLGFFFHKICDANLYICLFISIVIAQFVLAYITIKVNRMPPAE